MTSIYIAIFGYALLGVVALGAPSTSTLEEIQEGSEYPDGLEMAQIREMRLPAPRKDDNHQPKFDGSYPSMEQLLEDPYAYSMEFIREESASHNSDEQGLMGRYSHSIEAVQETPTRNYKYPQSNLREDEPSMEEVKEEEPSMEEMKEEEHWAEDDNQSTESVREPPTMDLRIPTKPIEKPGYNLRIPPTKASRQDAVREPASFDASMENRKDSHSAELSMEANREFNSHYAYDTRSPSMYSTNDDHGYMPSMEAVMYAPSMETARGPYAYSDSFEDNDMEPEPITAPDSFVKEAIRKPESFLLSVEAIKEPEYFEMDAPKYLSEEEYEGSVEAVRLPAQFDISAADAVKEPFSLGKTVKQLLHSVDFDPEALMEANSEDVSGGFVKDDKEEEPFAFLDTSYDVQSKTEKVTNTTKLFVSNQPK